MIATVALEYSLFYILIFKLFLEYYIVWSDNFTGKSIF